MNAKANPNNQGIVKNVFTAFLGEKGHREKHLSATRYFKKFMTIMIILI